MGTRKMMIHWAWLFAAAGVGIAVGYLVRRQPYDDDV